MFYLGTQQKQSNQTKSAFVGYIMWVVAEVAIKVSILDLYIRVFRDVKLRRLAYILMALSTIASVGFFLAVFLICRPTAYFWDRSIQGSCSNERLALLFPGIFNMILDILILSLPMRVLWDLQVTRQRKILSFVVFGMGFS